MSAVAVYKHLEDLIKVIENANKFDFFSSAVKEEWTKVEIGERRLNRFELDVKEFRSNVFDIVFAFRFVSFRSSLFSICFS